MNPAELVDLALLLVRLAVKIWPDLDSHLSPELRARIRDILPERSLNDPP